MLHVELNRPQTPGLDWAGVEGSLLGRALGHIICSLVGFKRIIFKNIFPEGFKGYPSLGFGKGFRPCTL